MVRELSDLCRRGGKRLRPALLSAGFRAVRPRGSLEIALDASLSLELLQAYFLIHDDWMDGDVERRGGPTVHAALTRRLKSEHQGSASAILAGDYAAALAQELLSELPLRPGVLSPVLGCFAEMQLSAVAGQQIDLLARAKNIEQAYALKTGSYTVRGPLRLGALLGGASAATLAALDRFSEPLGIAFQLRDDLLNVFGDPKVSGKRLGGDLRAGKRTLLTMEALLRTRGAERRILERVLGNPRARAADLHRACEVLERSGARARVEARIVTLSERALGALGGRIPEPGRTLLAGAVAALAFRGT